MRQGLTRCLAALCLLTALSAAAGGAAAGERAERILAAAGRPVGLAHLPGGDVDLALALAAGSPGCVVHVQLADGEAVAAARSKAYAAGVLNRRVFIDHGGLDRLLPVGRSCDLVVVPAGAKATGALAGEVKRVLHPWYGLAVVPDAAWAGRVGRPEEREGLHVAIAGPLEGSDDWAQWWHGADNNCVSTDTAFSLPATMQWVGKPFFAPTRIALPIVAGGRLFTLWNGSEMDMGRGMPSFASAPEGDGPILMAQAAGSGGRLWLRRLSPAVWVQAARSTVVADGERLLVADGKDLLVLDAATGRERRRMAIETGEIKWLALDGERVFLVGGAKTVSQGRRSNANLPAFRSSGEVVMALERETLEPAWRRERSAAEKPFDPRSPAVSGGRLFICRADDRVEAWSVADGRTIWSVKAGFERGSDAKGYYWDSTSRHPVSGYAIAGVYVISGAEMQEAVVLSQADGRRLWSTATKGRKQFCPLGFNDLVWGGRRSLDPETGRPLGRLPNGGLLFTREGKGRDFRLEETADAGAAPGADRRFLGELRMIQGPTTYTIERLEPGGRYVLRLHWFEPWNDEPGLRLMDVSVNGEAALRGFDLVAEAGGKMRALTRDLPGTADDEGRVRLLIAGTPGAKDGNAVLSGIEVRRGERRVAVAPAAGAYAPIPGFRLNDGDSCSRSTMAPFLLRTVYDPPETLKSSCSAGSYAANGLLWKFPSPCTGCFEWRGFLQQAPRETGLPPAPVRLHRGAGGEPGAETPGGWPAYHGDGRRSSSSGAKAPAGAAVAWRVAAPIARPERPAGVMMDAEFVPTPPLVAGDTVIVARTDGTVEALGLGDGRRRWRAWTGGRIQSAPAVWRGRVFVGSCDGLLYAFSLADGRELWRLRVAPEAGRMMVYEQLGSRWPVVGAPVVVGDEVVASAGLVGSIDGVHMVGADAASGEVRWERGEWEAAETEGKISGGAQFAAADAIFYHGGDAPPIRLDPRDGTAHPAFPAGATRLLQGWPRNWQTIKAFRGLWGQVKGQDVGVIYDRWLCYGGRRIWTEQEEDGTWRFSLKILARGEDGGGRLPVIDVAGASRLPAWDDASVLFCVTTGIGGRNRVGGLVLFERKRFEETLEGLLAGTDAGELAGREMKDMKPGDLSRRFDPTAEGLGRWAHAWDWAWSARAWVLTGDAAVAAIEGKNQQRLVALERSDGSVRWKLDLPARPVQDGLAVAADGRIVVTLVDGSTLCVGGE
jgi:outer membrane protein assembly factor BamB